MKFVNQLLAVSITANAGLIAVLALKPRLMPAGMRDMFTHSSAAAANPVAPKRGVPTVNASGNAAGLTDAAAAGRAKLWSALDSEDLPTLVKRLRTAGFSRSVILSILNARLDARFAERMRTLTGDVENTPFWKPDPMNLPGNSKYWEQYSQIYRERSRLLRDLLGDDSLAWPGMDPDKERQRQFGEIPKGKTDLVQRIVDDYAEMSSQIRASMQGISLPEDREKLALLEREKRADLAGILSPSELEEFEIRASPLTSRLRGALTLMDASEQEFRAIIKVQQAFNDRINPMMGGVFSSQMMDERREAQNQMNDQLKATLPPDRYSEYMRASNPEYQQLRQIAQKENVPAETVARAYSLRETIAAESVRIVDNTALSPEQKRAALTALAQKGRTEILSTLGPGAGEAYAQSARWLTSIERGTAVTFGPDGGTVTRPIRPPR